MAEGNIEQMLKKYRELTQKALEKISVSAAPNTRERAIAEDFLQMARSYFSDAGHFEKEGRPLTALAAYSYAHAWLDAGARARVLDAKGDSGLFTLP